MCLGILGAGLFPLLLLLFLLLLLRSCCLGAGDNTTLNSSRQAMCLLQQQQYDGLMAMKAAWGIQSWGRGQPPGCPSQDELPTPAHCSWAGVECAGAAACNTNSSILIEFTALPYYTPCYNGTVTALRLGALGLAGPIPSEPWGPFNQTLKELDLEGGFAPGQSLTGTIPQTLSLLSNLQELTLAHNGG